MAKKIQPRSFNDVLSTLGSHQFDVAATHDGAASNVTRVAGAKRVSKYGVAAEIAPVSGDGAPVEIVARAGWVLGGEISRLTDKGYQKFLTTTRLQIPATAEHLRANHEFSEELNEATGVINLYNESLGTTSDRYVYDRVKGRD
jgi:hypothetical protein